MAPAEVAEVAVGSSRAVGAAPRVGLLYDDRMCAHAMPDGKYHEENPERLRAIWRKLTAEGVASRCVAMKAKEASEDCIASVHTENHVKLIKNISSKKYDSHRNRTSRRFNSIYFNEGSSESAFLAAGSVIEVSEKVATGELNSAIALVRPPGHHAEHDKPMGFCLFNNVPVGANHLLNERPDLGIKKLAILDWDAHHGNGTQKMFYEDPRVLFFSVHRFDGGNFYPFQKDASHRFVGKGAGKGYNINIPWEHAGCGDADYIAVWDHVLLPVAKAFDADIILLSAGFDAALGDPLGGCCITPNGYALLLTKLLGFAKGRIVMALEGGYNLESIANSVCACTKVLLGDKFTFDAPEMQPFESTWKIIQMVRDELKRYWPVLSSKLPENIPLRSTPSDIQLSEEQVVAPSAEIVPTVATVQNMTENEISQEQAADAEQRLNENDRTERQETEPPAGDVQNADEIGLSRDASRTAENSQPTPDTSDGAIQCKLIVPSTYQGFSVLQDSEIHGFATADELRGAINANYGCLTEGQVLGLLHNLSVFQLQINDFPENEVICKGVVMTVSGDARVLFPITTVYSTVGKILKEHGPQKLKISGIHIEKFEVKGNLWTRSRYTIDNTSHVYEWSTILNKEQVVLRRPRVSFADVVASNNRVVESNADVVASNNRVVESNAGVVAAGNRVVDACADVVAASTTLANSINGLATVIQAGRVH